jgi:hypothetical protein
MKNDHGHACIAFECCLAVFLGNEQFGPDNYRNGCARMRPSLFGLSKTSEATVIILSHF